MYRQYVEVQNLFVKVAFFIGYRFSLKLKSLFNPEDFLCMKLKEKRLLDQV